MFARKAVFLSAVAAVLVLALPRAGVAESFSSVVVFGDSLSDDGNLYSAIGYPPPPYYNGRFSNGPVAVEQLAANLGVPLVDYAYGGATTGVGDAIDGGSQTMLGVAKLPGMLTQLNKSTVPLALYPTSLFVVWGGANDFESGGSVAVAVSDIDSIVSSLLAKGATHVLVPGLPNLALTPEFYGNPLAAAVSTAFNQALIASLPQGATYFDTASVLNTIVANPSAYGFTNVNTACLTATSLCSNPNQYLFFDDIHPTTAADTILAQQFQSAVTPTPEPSSLVLLGSGAAGLVAVFRRRWAA